VLWRPYTASAKAGKSLLRDPVALALCRSSMSATKLGFTIFRSSDNAADIGSGRRML